MAESPQAQGQQRKRVVCTCHSFSCYSKTYLDTYGRSQRGHLVSTTTRSTHRARDRDAGETTQPIDDKAGDILDGELIRGPVMQLPVAQGVDNQQLENLNHSIVLIICTLVSWLHLSCGLSRAAAGKVLQVLQAIILASIRLGKLMEQSASSALGHRTTFSLPRDLRTAMSKISIEPNLIRSICCPKCYTKYTLTSMPQVCSYKETPRSRRCGEELWTTRSTRVGPRVVPRRLYSTQDFESWLTYFLSRPGIEDHIDASYAHRSSPEVMESIWDSPAWKSLGTFTTTRGNLTFSYFIDWFNPYTNKIAGKSSSCGAIMMFCLNLPYELQRLPENTFFAGMTPPPREPTVTTITALADPVVDQLEALWTGKTIRTYRHPEGMATRVAVLPAIGDLMAIRKALGFSGISSHNFCSFCDLQLSQIDVLDPQKWKERVGVNVLAAAVEWKEATTKKDRARLVKKNGVRWSALHRLPYRDPVRHTLLRTMHNWDEGVLQHHARVKWGIGGIPKVPGNADDPDNHFITTPPPSPLTPTESINGELEIDAEMLDDEVIALEEEQRQFHDDPTHLDLLRLSLTDIGTHCEIGSPSGPSDPDDPSSSEDEDEDEIWTATCIFSSGELFRIRQCLSCAVVPSWLERPPTNFGEKSHGKLKADQWFQLFSVFLPLVLPEIWLSKSGSLRPGAALLTNFHDLVTCTNIVCAYTTSAEAADLYLDHYIQYRKSSKRLFPNVNTRPNHHYAMHNADLMKFWGPLIKLSEFSYEQHNGSLQKINTNHHPWELDFTMLRQICRRGRLNAHIQASTTIRPTSDKNTSTDVLCGHGVLDPLLPSASVLPVNREESPSHKLTLLPDLIYQRILAIVNTNPSELVRHFQSFPHPTDAVILSPYATPLSHVIYKTRRYTISAIHSGNGTIGFKTVDGFLAFGKIETMWEVLLGSNRQVFVAILPYQQLSEIDHIRSPYTSHPGFQCTVVYSRLLPLEIIGLTDVVGHVASYERPSHTFGIPHPITIITESLYRNRA